MKLFEIKQISSKIWNFLFHVPSSHSEQGIACKLFLILLPQSSQLQETGAQNGVFGLNRFNGLTDWVR